MLGALRQALLPLFLSSPSVSNLTDTGFQEIIGETEIGNTDDILGMYIHTYIQTTCFIVDSCEMDGEYLPAMGKGFGSERLRKYYGNKLGKRYNIRRRCISVRYDNCPSESPPTCMYTFFTLFSFISFLFQNGRSLTFFWMHESERYDSEADSYTT